VSSRCLIEMICDECSYVETFVHLERNQNGAVATVDIVKAADIRGWTTQPQFDSRLLALNFCGVCSKRKSKA
jgi:hypothetical protein